MYFMYFYVLRRHKFYFIGFPLLFPFDGYHCRSQIYILLSYRRYSYTKGIRAKTERPWIQGLILHPLMVTTAMPAGISWSRYLTFLTASMLSMFAGASVVHNYFKPNLVSTWLIPFYCYKIWPSPYTILMGFLWNVTKRLSGKIGKPKGNLKRDLLAMDGKQDRQMRS